MVCENSKTQSLEKCKQNSLWQDDPTRNPPMVLSSLLSLPRRNINSLKLFWTIAAHLGLAHWRRPFNDRWGLAGCVASSHFIRCGASPQNFFMLQRCVDFVDLWTWLECYLQRLEIALTFVTVPPGFPSAFRAGNSTVPQTPPFRSAAFTFMTLATPLQYRAMARDILEKYVSSLALCTGFPFGSLPGAKMHRKGFSGSLAGS